MEEELFGRRPCTRITMQTLVQAVDEMGIMMGRKVDGLVADGLDFGREGGQVSERRSTVHQVVQDASQ